LHFAALALMMDDAKTSERLLIKMNFEDIATTYLYKGNIRRLKAILMTKQATKF
jgi:hypothetical protein